MSFTLIQQATPRLHRSELAVPGSNPTFMEKAASAKARGPAVGRAEEDSELALAAVVALHRRARVERARVAPLADLGR